MFKKGIIFTLALVLNVLLVLCAMAPEFVTFAEIAPYSLAGANVIPAAAAGREQVISVIQHMHTELYVLAASNLGVVLWALRAK
jgi:hypothetical protein